MTDGQIVGAVLIVLALATLTLRVILSMHTSRKDHP